MEEYEDLKKIYTEKEKENLKLKDELFTMKGKYYISGNSEKDNYIDEKTENVIPDDLSSSKTSFMNLNNENFDFEINKDQNKYNNKIINNYCENVQKQFVLNQKHTNNPNNIKYNAYNYSENLSSTNYPYQIDNYDDNRQNTGSSKDSSIVQNQQENFFTTKVNFFLKKTAKTMDLGKVYVESIFKDKLNNKIEIKESNQVNLYNYYRIIQEG